jgi:hypothetical protein
MRRLVLLGLLAFTCMVRTAHSYDPLTVPDTDRAAPLDLDVVDDDRSRTVPIRVFLPPRIAGDEPTPCPVVLFSHGLGGSRAGGSFLGHHWSRRGYAVVFLQHPGSDESVWRDAPPFRRLAAMRDAASLENFTLRVGDVPAVLDHAEHSAFTGRPLPGDREPRNPAHHRAILALSTAFWDAFLRDDAAARAWLDGNGPRTALEDDDRWQRK